jgi:hypothetical protein
LWRSGADRRSHEEERRCNADYCLGVQFGLHNETDCAGKGQAGRPSKG